MMRGVLLAAGLALAAPAVAQQSPIVVSSPWLRATPNSAPVAGGYATIKNNGAMPDTLVGASLAIAPVGEIHSMTMSDGVMHMAKLEQGLKIAPGATVTLSPGGNHLMFLHPTVQLKAGQTVEGALVFERAGKIAVAFAVATMGAKIAPGARAAGAPGGGMPGMDMH